jgi:hypothetical protein
MNSPAITAWFTHELIRFTEISLAWVVTFCFTLWLRNRNLPPYNDNDE